MRKLIEELFSRYYKDIYSYLFSMSRDAALSEDLTSEVFLEVVRSIVTFRGESDIKTWLFSIARYKWYAHLRKNNRMPTNELSDYLCTDTGAPDTQYIDKITAERICRILDDEPERTKTIVLMRTEGYSFYEIAQKVGVSENSARVIDFRAKAKIRKILTEEGLYDE